MADNQVTTQFTADASGAVAGAQLAVDATKTAAAEMQRVVGKPLSFQSHAQAGGITSAIGRQTVAQKEAAEAARKSNDAIRRELEKTQRAYQKTAAEAARMAASTGKSIRGLGGTFSFSGLKSTLAGIRGIGTAIAAATAIGVGLSKVIDSWSNRTEDVRKQLDDLTASAKAFGQTALFNAKNAGLEDTQKAIAALREGAQKEIDALVAKTTESQKSITGIFKSFVGLGPSVEEQAKAATQAIEQINSQVNAAAKEIEKRAADQRAKQRAESEKKANQESLERAKSVTDETAKIEAGLIDDAEERARALFRIEQKAQAERLKEAKTAEERDALFALGKAKFAAYQAELTKIVEDEEAKRAEAVARSVAEQIAEYEALQGAINSAFQAQQQFSQSITSGFGSDIKAIRQLLEIRGGWKK